MPYNRPIRLPTLGEMIGSPKAGKEAGILDRFFAMLQERRARNREQQTADVLQGLDELNRQNELNPTAKRTRAVQNLEERLRMDGILK